MLTFSSEQCRVIGVLLEKESTTPDQYPLSLNALTNGCNQESNRDPVYSLSEDEVQQVVDQLIELNCINCQSEKMRILAYSLYEQPMAKGKVVFSKGRPFEWEAVKPSTVNGLFLNVSCSQIEID